MSATALVGLAPTILGPLTTVFTPPPSCTVAVGQVDSGGLLGLGALLGGGGSAGNFAFLGQSCAGGQPTDAASCWPPTTTGAPAPPKGEDIGRWGVYSPGIECPAGYATACSATAGGATGWPLQFSLTAGETAVGCCPSGYGCANVGGQTCTMLATSTVIQTATCDGNKMGSVETSSAAAFSLYAPMIQINFQSSDLPAQPTSAPGVVPVPVPGPTAGTFTTRTTTTVMAGSPSPTSSTSSQSQTSNQFTASSMDTSSATTSSSSSSSSSTSSTSPPSSTSPSSSLESSSPSPSPSTTPPPSEGFPRLAAVGIGVGGGVAALLIGGSALLYFLRRRRNRREEESLDRLYGLGKLDSLTSGGSVEWPGVYRGQIPTRAGTMGSGRGVGNMRQVNF